jgi:hypothetical protein
MVHVTAEGPTSQLYLGYIVSNTSLQGKGPKYIHSCERLPVPCQEKVSVAPMQAVLTLVVVKKRCTVPFSEPSRLLIKSENAGSHSTVPPIGCN